MASSLNGTGITFSDATTLSTQPVTSFIGQTGAVNPTTLGNLGSIVAGIYLVNTPTASGQNGINSYAQGTTIAGSSIGYNFSISCTSSFGGSFSSGTLRGTTSGYIGRSHINGSETSFAFPGSGSAVGTSSAMYIYVGNAAGYTGSNGSISYSTLSGSWQSLSPFNVTMFPSICGSSPNGVWNIVYWQRYA